MTTIDWEKSLQKKPEVEMSEIELAVGQIYENKAGDVRREIVAIYGNIVAVKCHSIHDAKWCSIMEVDDFLKNFSHKLVDSLEFPAPKKMVKKSQCVAMSYAKYIVDSELYASEADAKKDWGAEFVSWPLVVNGVEQWIEVEINEQ
jgi:hypothetical protein